MSCFSASPQSVSVRLNRAIMSAVIGVVFPQGPDHVAIASDHSGGQSGVVSDEDARKVYERNVAIGVWDKQSYPPPPWVFPEGIEAPKTRFNLTGGLLRRGFSKDDFRKIWGGNWLRVMKEVWGV